MPAKTVNKLVTKAGLKAASAARAAETNTLSRADEIAAILALTESGATVDFDEKTMLIDGSVITFADPEARIMIITKDMADQLLLRNTKNRKPSLGNLNKILTDLRNDAYRFTGATIVLSTAGTLLDGQHRLLAVSISGIAIEAVLVTGVDPHAQSDMDSGKSRSLPEVLRFNGEINEVPLAAGIVGIQSWERGERVVDSSNGLTTNNTSLEFLSNNPTIREIVRESANLSQRVKGLTTKQITQLVWAFDKLDVDDRKDFFAKLVSGAGLEEGDPILTLRNFLNRDAASNARVSANYRLAVTAKAWNAYRDGRTVHALRFKAGGAKPEAFPEPM